MSKEPVTGTVEKHDEIVRFVKEHYKKKSYWVNDRTISLGRYKTDVIAIYDQDLVDAVEVKPNNKSEIRKGVGQCFSYIDWVHKVYLAVPIKSVELTLDLIEHTPIGLLTIIDNTLTTVKEATRTEAEPGKLTKLLGKTTGFCWLCGRTFNLVPRAGGEDGSIYIAHKEMEPGIFKSLEKATRQKVRTKGSWVSICTICSRILGSAIHEYLKRSISKEEFPDFDFDDLDLEETAKLLKNIQK
ncbi:MAG: hypothetical protein KAX04_00185 [Methanomicrobia archaeon]|nr:hypothetical protein [Methanomicrobia archaeon]